MENSFESAFELHNLQEWFHVYDLQTKAIYLLAFFLVLAMLAIIVSKKYNLPIVVGYVLFGIVISPDILNLIPFLESEFHSWYEFLIIKLDYITQIALAFIVFTIGSELSLRTFRRLGKSIYLITILEALGGAVISALAVYLVGAPIYMALLLGAIAAASAPASTIMVLKEYNAEGPLSSTLMAVVGLDNTLALILFALISPVAMMFIGTGEALSFQLLLTPVVEISAAILIGLVIGYLTQHYISMVDDKTKKVVAMLTSVVLSSALSLVFGLSSLIANLALGFAIRNFAEKNLEISEYLDTLTIPLYAMFFIFAGAEIRFSQMGSTVFLITALVFLISRIIGKYGGAILAGRFSDAAPVVKKYIGLGLFPQGGVAIALAFSVQKQFTQIPDASLMIFNMVILTAALTEIFGPLFTKEAVIRSGEAEE
ncbi:cation:proton antiporter [Halanaerobium saccharolyticum]|jgi:Kef-type K+ transport system membrane component KefB|uniref:cation:proton antiporter n=1 Tax=Halanaerobium saccharolyticum TaxID=43595 RepID=UPI003FCDB6AC